MVRLFRARVFCLLTAGVLAFGTMTAALGELLHAGTSHDLACSPAAELGHDAASHRFDAPDEPGAAGHHCLGCHLARWSRLGAQTTSYVGHVESGVSRRPAAAIGSARAAALDSLPPRSPPRFL